MKYTKYALLTLLTIFVYCVAVPSLISLADTIYNIGGILLAIFYPPILIMLVKKDMKNVMKKLGLLALLVSTIGMMSSCSVEKVPAGTVGVKFNLYGDDKGVQANVVPPGRYWLTINEEIYEFPLFMQNVIWTKDIRPESPTDESITFQTVEGMEVGADIALSYRIEEAKVPQLFQKYRKGIEEITDTFLRSIIRDSFTKFASVMRVDAVYGEGKSKLLEDVNKHVTEYVAQDGIIIQKISIVGSFRLPLAVTQSLDSKIAAMQKAEQTRNEIEQSKAEAQKRVEEANGEAQAILSKAKAEAEANKMLTESLSAEVINYKALQIWDGKLPQVTGGTIPFIQVTPKP